MCVYVCILLIVLIVQSHERPDLNQGRKIGKMHEGAVRDVPQRIPWILGKSQQRKVAIAQGAGIYNLHVTDGRHPRRIVAVSMDGSHDVPPDTLARALVVADEFCDGLAAA